MPCKWDLGMYKWEYTHTYIGFDFFIDIIMLLRTTLVILSGQHRLIIKKHHFTGQIKMSLYGTILFAEAVEQAT